MPHSNDLPLAAIRYRRGFDVDDLLLRSCARLRSRGLHIGGLVQRSSGDGGWCASSTHVVDLRTGEMFDIWQDRGPCARACRLDEHSLLQTEASVTAAIADRVDLLVINRFGRAESLGRGLLGCFSAAVEASVPVLTAVRAPYEDAWRDFHGGLARDLSPEIGAVIDWLATSICRRVVISEQQILSTTGV